MVKHLFVDTLICLYTLLCFIYHIMPYLAVQVLILSTLFIFVQLKNRVVGRELAYIVVPGDTQKKHTPKQRKHFLRGLADQLLHGQQICIMVGVQSLTQAPVYTHHTSQITQRFHLYLARLSSIILLHIYMGGAEAFHQWMKEVVGGLAINRWLEDGSSRFEPKSEHTCP